jgi:integrase
MTKRRIPPLQGDSVKIFREAVRSDETWKTYERRFHHFLEWLGESPDGFVKHAKQDKAWAEKKIFDYIILNKERVKRGEIGDGSVCNAVKPIRLFADMNDVLLNWKKINRTLPSKRRSANDRAPTLDELRKLLRFPDLRVEVIVLFTCSSGIRVGAWDGLKLKHLKPIERDGVLVACKVTVYANESEEYATFITPEAYRAVENYVHFRQMYGENISPNSPILRNAFNTTKRRGNFGTAIKPVPLKHSAVKHLMERAMWKLGIRKEKLKRHEFAVDHGFRKFFKTRAEQVMKTINIEWMMGHNTGLSENYYRPTEQELLNEYLKAVPLLTISEVEEVRQEKAQVQSEFEERLHRIEALVTSLVSQKELQALALDAHHKPDTVQ